MLLQFLSKDENDKITKLSHDEVITEIFYRIKTVQVRIVNQIINHYIDYLYAKLVKGSYVCYPGLFMISIRPKKVNFLNSYITIPEEIVDISKFQKEAFSDDFLEKISTRQTKVTIDDVQSVISQYFSIFIDAFNNNIQMKFLKLIMFKKNVRRNKPQLINIKETLSIRKLVEQSKIVFLVFDGEDFFTINSDSDEVGGAEVVISFLDYDLSDFYYKLTELGGDK